MIATANAVSTPHTTHDLYTKRREWNEQIVRAKIDTKIIELWQAHGSQFSCVNISTALISFAKWKITPDGQKCLRDMLQHYIANAALIRLRDAASTVSSLAKIELIDAESEQIQKALSCIIVKKAVSKSDFYDKPHLTSLVQLLQSFDDQGHQIDPLLKAVEPQAVRCFTSSYQQEERFTQSVVELATFYSKKEYKAALLFQEIQKHVLQSLHNYSAIQLLKIAYACASLATGTKDFYDSAYRKIKRGLDTLDASGIESCLYVYGQSEEKLALTKSLEVLITSNISTWSNQDFTSIVATFANRHIGSDSFFVAIECETLNRMQSFTPNSLARITSSFAIVNGGSYSFFSNVENKVIETIELFSTEELVQVYLAFSISRLADGKFLLKIEDELRSRDSLTPQSTAVLMWSMLLARSIEEKYLTVLLDLLNQACEDNTLEGIHPQTLIDIELMIEADVPELGSKIKRPLACAIEQSKQVMLRHKPESSSFLNEVVNALERSGYTFEIHKFLNGLYVDIFIPSEMLAINVCDASHYYRMSPNELTALSLIKKRILETMGYKMLHIPHFEWSWSKQQQEIYLKELFARQYCPIAEITYK